jgi:hypothetical protein
MKYFISIGWASADKFMPITPSKLPAEEVADDDELDGADESGCFAPLHAAASNSEQRSAREMIVSGDLGTSRKRKTANRIIAHPFLIGYVVISFGSAPGP